MYTKFVVFFLLLNVCVGRVVKFPIVPQDKLESHTKAILNLHGPSHSETKLQNFLTKIGSSLSARSSCYCKQMFIEIDVGTPAQTLKVELQLLTEYTYILSKSADPNNTKHFNLYDESASTTNVNVEDSMFDVDGYLIHYARDSLNAGGSSFKNVTFMVFDKVPNIRHEHNAGFLGLSEKNAFTNYEESLWQIIAKQITEPIWTIALPNDVSINTPTLTIGSTDTDNCEDKFSWVENVADPDSYYDELQFNVTGATVGNEKIENFTLTTIDIYPNSNLFITSKDMHTKIVALTEAEQDNKYGSYYVDCEKQLDGVAVELTLTSGDKLQIPVTRLVIQDPNEEELCILNVYHASYSETYWPLGGDILFQDTCLARNTKTNQLGFSPYRTAKDVSPTVAPPTSNPTTVSVVHDE